MSVAVGVGGGVIVSVDVIVFEPLLEFVTVSVLLVLAVSENVRLGVSVPHLWNGGRLFRRWTVVCTRSIELVRTS